MKKLGLIALLAVLTLIVTSTVVQAQWSALNSGYAITTNYHGIDVPLGESVTAWAGTTMPDGPGSVVKVRFIWKDPDENVVWDPFDTTLDKYTTPAYPPGAPQEIIDWATNHPGIDVWYATDEQTPAVYGDWGVQAEFWGPGGKLKGTGGSEGIIKIKATSFFNIPEAISTLTVLLTMLAGLAIFARKRF